MPHCSDLQNICQRIREKSRSYERYNFTSEFNDFLKAFFDLAQEYDSLDDFYRICVAVPLEMTGLHSALYLADEKTGELYLACDSLRGVCQQKDAAPEYVTLSMEAYQSEHSYIVPIYNKMPARGMDVPEDGGQEKATEPCSAEEIYSKNRILGMFRVFPLEKLSSDDCFFLKKYTNRIGYNLHNRLIALQNIEHLKFINTLVMDIEHNVIVPNMYFRHLFNKLRKKIAELETLRDEIREKGDTTSGTHCESCLSHCDSLSDDLLFYHSEIVKHHS
ncbi:MAG: sensor histidine kinase, partial [Candidatus Electrothrix sp. EH2]|nr:sensor histidine kinase [Candidatus Electrothrix sp. EH2]